MNVIHSLILIHSLTRSWTVSYRSTTFECAAYLIVARAAQTILRSLGGAGTATGYYVICVTVTVKTINKLTITGSSSKPNLKNYLCTSASIVIVIHASKYCTITEMLGCWHY